MITIGSLRVGLVYEISPLSSSNLVQLRLIIFPFVDWFRVFLVALMLLILLSVRRLQG